MMQRSTAVALVAILCVAAVLADTNTSALTNCEVCAATGDCSHAFHGTPGQFCGDWVDKGDGAEHKKCCCPVDADCLLSPYDCRCTNKRSHAVREHHADTKGGLPLWATLLIVFGSVAAVMVVIWALHRYCCSSDRQERVVDTSTPSNYGATRVASPQSNHEAMSIASTESNCGTTRVASVQPNYGAKRVKRPYHASTTTGAAVGATTGFTGGYLHG